MSELSPEQRAFITVGGIRYELIPTQKWTFPETREAKAVSGGMNLAEIERGIAGVDGDAWMAWIYVSVKRSYPRLSVEELEASIGDTPLVAVLATVEREAPEVAEPDPPASAAPNGGPVPPSVVDSSEMILQPSTLERLGESSTPTLT